MTRKTRQQQEFEEGHGYGRQDWEAVNSPELTDKELAELKPARQVLPKAFFNAVDEARRGRGRPRMEAPKQAVTLRLNPETLARFKAGGDDWRARMSDVLDKAKVG